MIKLKLKEMNRRKMAAILVLILVVAVLGLDIAILTFAASVNDDVCRNAAKSAAQGDDIAKATMLAKSAVKNCWTDGYFVSSPVMTFLDYQNFGGTPPDGEGPYVQVRTEVTVRLPVRIPFFGLKLNKNNEMIFEQTYAYPIIKKNK